MFVHLNQKFVLLWESFKSQIRRGGLWVKGRKTIILSNLNVLLSLFTTRFTACTGCIFIFFVDVCLFLKSIWIGLHRRFITHLFRRNIRICFHVFASISNDNLLQFGHKTVYMSVHIKDAYNLQRKCAKHRYMSRCSGHQGKVTWVYLSSKALLQTSNQCV